MLQLFDDNVGVRVNADLSGSLQRFPDDVFGG
jgi:hypothetical protein